MELIKKYILFLFLTSSVAKRNRAQDEVFENNSQEETTTPKVEAVVEKFVDTLMASERYLKLVETVERKVNQLDTRLQERSNSIIKYLSELMRLVQAPNLKPSVLEASLKSLKTDLEKLKGSLVERTRAKMDTSLQETQMRGCIVTGFLSKQLAMLTRKLFVLVALSSISCDIHRRQTGRWKKDNTDKVPKKEYEDELTDTLVSKRKTDDRVVQSDNDVIEKLIDTITSSDKYLKKMDSINLRLNRLDSEVHDKSNSISAQLTEIMRAFKSVTFADKLEAIMETINTQVNQIKYLLEKVPQPDSVYNTVDGASFHADSSLDTRLGQLENNVKTVVVGVDSILATIAEVKNKQLARTLSKMDGSSIDPLNLIYEFKKSVNKYDCKNGRYDRSERYPTDCHEIQLQGFNVSGIYKIRPEDEEPFYALCDLNTAGGGWTVFQSRFDGSQDFYKGWTDYKHGFGNLAGEFWLGLHKLSSLTYQKLYELRVELETHRGQEATAGYSVFSIGPEHEGYRISTLGSYYGTAGDSLTYHAGQKFSTFDMDNDEWTDGACASEHGGAWWYKECDKSNLNGQYSTSEENRDKSAYWISFKSPDSPLAKIRMMIRPLPATKPFDKTEKLRGRHEPRGMRSRQREQARPRTPYRYKDSNHDDFFPNYA